VGNLDLLKEKLDSIPEHMCNIHYFADNKHFKQCGHDPLSIEKELATAWMEPDKLVSSY